MLNKACSKCKIEKPATLEYFTKNSRVPSGLGSWCRDCHRERNNTWTKRNPEKAKQRDIRYAENNREKINLKSRKTYAKNPNVNKDWQAVKRKRFKQATPNNTEIQKQIKEIYKNCPDGCHVDHILPISNPLVCGLHVPWNLQYLLAELNLKKSNKFEPYAEAKGG